MLFNNSQYIGIRTLFFVVLSIVIMMADHRHHQFGTVRSFLSDAVAPLQYTVNWPMDVADWVKSSFSAKHELIKENTHLKMQNLLLKAKVQKILALQKENKSLRALLQSSNQVTGRVEVAQLLAVDMDSYIAQAILNKGASKKVFVGQPVLGAKGVMGQITHVNHLTSRLMLITDTRSAVPIVDNRTGMRAIAVGMGPHRPLALINIPETADIAVGDKITTSGLGLRYPVGYPLGIVTKVVEKPGQQYAKVVVSPTARLYRDRQVLLVWEQQANISDEAKRELQQMEKEDRNLNQQLLQRVRDGG